ncbi:MAG: hypothetical protein GQ564_08700 [Bacteroidales bacterium]|nr:hypothetical protein [Bacteroidales bacterium]
MGLFGKSKKAKSPMEELMKRIFPNGKSDIISGTDELLSILHSNISRDTVQNIFVKAMAISVMTEKFDVERLKLHLDGYCKDVFGETELQKFYEYLVARKVALMMGAKNVFRNQDGNYAWK